MAKNGWRRHLPLAAILFCGALANVPALDAPRFLDDYLHVSMIEGGFPAARGPFDLYTFVDDGDRGELVDRGLLPWWADARLQIRFFRPLSSGLRWGEHQLIGGSQVLLHLHSFAWWAAAVLAAYTLYRRAFNRRVTLLATLMFAVTPSHAIPLTWLANREALVSLALGTFGLFHYVSWRTARRPRDGLLATLLFALAAFGGEYSLCLTGYVVAFELFGASRPSTLLRRGVGVLPFVVPVGAYLALRTALGYGSAGTGFYSDPLHDLGAFLKTAPWRFASLVGNGWLGIDTSPWVPGPLRTGYLVVLAIAAVLVGIALTRAMRQLDAATRANATWLLAGSFLALVPILAVLPSTRLLGVSVLGIAPAIAVLCDHTWFPETPHPRRGLAELTALVTLLLAFAHIVQAPVNSFLSARQIRRSATDFARRARIVESALVRTGSTQPIFVRGYGGVFFLPFALEPHGAPPAHWCVLANTGHVLVLRPDARTLEIIAASGDTLFPQTVGDLFRGESARLQVGQELVAPGMRVTILEVGENGPTSARYVFDRDLDDPSFLWLTDASGTIQIVHPPGPGLGAPFDP